MVTFHVMHDETPMEGAAVMCPADTMMTDVDGQAGMPMEVGTHSFSVSMAGYEDYTGTFDVVDDAVDVMISMVGMDQLDASSFSLYPNPTSGILNITKEGNYRITVVNAVGKIIVTKQANDNTTIDLQNASEGIYFIRLQDGNKVETQRFIINR